jgi:hypothetical protein
VRVRWVWLSDQLRRNKRLDPKSEAAKDAHQAWMPRGKTRVCSQARTWIQVRALAVDRLSI